MGVMTSLQRVLTALSHKEPDRVPVLLTVSLHGAKELGLSIESYFSRAENVVEGQLRLRRKYGHDCLYNLFYAAVEHEAFGGDALFSDDGPPNAGAPVLRSREDIFALEVPEVDSHPKLRQVLETTERLAEEAAGEVPVIGVAVAPASLPIPLMGFERYLTLLHEDAEAAERLFSVTKAFCIRWARAQLAAGATAIGYFDPMSSTTITDDALFERFVDPIARETIPQLGGPAALHLASGKAGDRLERFFEMGAAMLGVSGLENLAELKRRAAGKIALLGNLNGVEMASWTPYKAVEVVTDTIEQGAPGGGFVLADNHGEIPYQVSDDVLLAVMETARRVGRYPIQTRSDEP